MRHGVTVAAFPIVRGRAFLSTMPILQTLGRIRLVRDDGSELDELLRQPKRLALLAYLAAPRPGVWHRRDVLLVVFWPDLDTQRARTALRNALYVLRQHLGEGVIRTRGDEEVSVDPALFSTDAALMEADVVAGRFAEALDRYEGEALSGLHITGAEGFEHWLDGDRARLKALARTAGRGVADAREHAGDFNGAADALARIAPLDVIDESVTRRLIALRDRAGDRARALEVYERFRAQLASEFGAEPAAETVALADEIRARRAPERSVESKLQASRVGTEIEPAADPTASRTSVAEENGTARSVAGTRERVDDSMLGPALQASRLPTPRRAFPMRIVAAAVLLFGGIAAAGFVMLRSAAPRAQTLIVLPMENATGRADLDYLATGIDEEVARRLRGIGALATIKSAARAEWPAATRADFSRIGREFGAQVAYRSRLTQIADSFVVSGSVVDIASGRVRDLGVHPFTLDAIGDLTSRIAAAVSGAVFRAPLPAVPHGGGERTVDAESFRLTLAGWHELMSLHDVGRAKDLFTAALERDPTNARAMAGLSSAWASLAVTWGVPFDEGAPLAEAAAERALALDSLEGTAWANLAAMRAYRTHSVSGVEPLFKKAIALDPANPEIYQVLSALYRHAWRWNEARDATRIARELDPLSGSFVEREAVIGLCRDDPAEALRLYRVRLQLESENPDAHVGLARALARLGRWEEAAAEYRVALKARAALRTGHADSSSIAGGTSSHSDSIASDTTLAGERAYWALIESDAKPRLRAALGRARTTWVSPVQVAALYVASGEVDTGLAMLSRLAKTQDYSVYRMPCQADMDRVHSDPRFKAIMASLPRWDSPEGVSRP